MNGMTNIRAIGASTSNRTQATNPRTNFITPKLSLRTAFNINNVNKTTIASIKITSI